MHSYQADVAAPASTHAQELNERLDSTAQGVRPSSAMVSLCSVDQSMLAATSDTVVEPSILWGDVFVESRLEAFNTV